DEAPRHRHDAVAAPQGVCRARSVAPKREGCRAGRAGSKGRRLMVPMRLYHEVRGCSLAVDIVARELGIPLDLIWVDVPRKLLPDGSNYYDVNPKGPVAGLAVPHREYLTEGAVIMQYLADQRPESG